MVLNIHRVSSKAAGFLSARCPPLCELEQVDKKSHRIIVYDRSNPETGRLHTPTQFSNLNCLPTYFSRQGSRAFIIPIPSPITENNFTINLSIPPFQIYPLYLTLTCGKSKVDSTRGSTIKI
jgi:hypothetical protein